MLHPNAIAIRYIWERFIETWIAADTKNTMLQVEKIQNRLTHQPFHSNSEAYQQFLTALQSDIKGLQKQYPFITF